MQKQPYVSYFELFARIDTFSCIKQPNRLRHMANDCSRKQCRRYGRIYALLACDAYKVLTVSSFSQRVTGCCS